MALFKDALFVYEALQDSRNGRWRQARLTDDVGIALRSDPDCRNHKRLLVLAPAAFVDQERNRIVIKLKVNSNVREASGENGELVEQNNDFIQAILI